MPVFVLVLIIIPESYDDMYDEQWRPLASVVREFGVLGTIFCRFGQGWHSQLPNGIHLTHVNLTDEQ
eukprot:1393772-Amorphochlora_amoeboformis.AAC.1